MRVIDTLAVVLVIVGALNWGLVGAARFNLVEALFGASIVASAVYTLVGLAALYQILAWKGIRVRSCTPHAVHA